MQFEIITPEKTVYKGSVESIRVPGRKGSFQILKDHAPIISTLGPGIVAVVTNEKKLMEYPIKGGVVEVKDNQIMLLAEAVLTQNQ